MPFKPSFAGSAPEPIRDKRLTAQHWRVYLAVLFHDRFSLPKEKGKGCNAKNLTLAEETQMAYAAVCRSLTDLVVWGYLTKERTGRETIYRGVYTKRKTLKECPIPVAPIGDEPVTNDAADDAECPAITCDNPIIDPAKTCDDFANFPPASPSDETETSAQYITLRGVIDTPKEGKEIPYKGRTVPERGFSGWKEAFDHLPNDGAKVSSFEKAWQQNPEWFEQDREAWARWLFDTADTYQGENQAIWAQAGRLWEEIAPC